MSYRHNCSNQLIIRGDKGNLNVMLPCCREANITASVDTPASTSVPKRLCLSAFSHIKAEGMHHIYIESPVSILFHHCFTLKQNSLVKPRLKLPLHIVAISAALLDGYIQKLVSGNYKTLYKHSHVPCVFWK